MKEKGIKLLLLLATLSWHAMGQTTVDHLADTGYVLPVVKIKGKFANDTDRYRYNQTKYYVTTILPYLKASTELFRDVDRKIHDDQLSARARRQYLHEKEDEMREKFEMQLKKLNVTQGGLLVKLIARQTELNLYAILKEFKNPLTAMKWQAWARMNGMNLDRKYMPEEEEMLENIMEELGYPLPLSYKLPYVNGL